MILLSTKNTPEGKRFGYYTESNNGNKKSGVFKHIYNSKQGAIKSICSDARDYGTAPYFDICDILKGVMYRMIWNPEKKKYEKTVLPNE